MTEERPQDNEETYDNPTFGSPDSKCIAGPTSSSHMQKSSTEKVTISSNKIESEVESEVGSWSGPEIWSGPTSWCDSDTSSWFETINASIDTDHALTNDNNMENYSDSQQNITNIEHQSVKEGKSEFEENLEDSVYIDDSYLPDNGADHDQVESDLSKGIENHSFVEGGSHSSDNSEDQDEYTPQNVKHRDSVLNKENEKDTNLDHEASNHKVNEEDEDNSEMGFPEVDNTSNALNNPIGNELETIDASDDETCPENITDVQADLVNNDMVDDNDEFPDDKILDKGDDVENGSLNTDTNSDEEMFPFTVNHTPNKNKENDKDDLSINVSPVQDLNPQGPLENNEGITVNQNVNVDLDIREEDNEHGWTILEVWSCFAMTAGAMPCWISNDGSQTQIHRNKTSTFLWYFSVTMYAAEIVFMIPQTLGVLNWKASIHAFLQLGINVSYVIFRLVCARMATSKVQHLVNTNDRLLSFPHCKVTSKKAVGIFVMLISTAIINVGLFIIFQTQVENDFVKIGFDNILEKLECIGKTQLTMSIDCTASTELSFVQITFALAGVLKTTHEITVGTVVFQGIIIQCWVLQFVSYNVLGIETQSSDESAHMTQNDLVSVTNLAEDMSKFIGEVLLGYLVYHAIDTPTELIFLFSGSPIAVLSIFLNRCSIYIGLILGSLASHKIKEIKDTIASRENMAQPQPVSRPGTAVLIAFLQETVLRKSVGIGVPGIFVINFKITFSYLGVVGTILTLIFSD